MLGIAIVMIFAGGIMTKINHEAVHAVGVTRFLVGLVLAAIAIT